MQKLEGIMPPMITPFKENGDVDYEAFAFNLQQWNRTGLGGYLVLGSNSESAYLNEAEKLELTRVARANCGSGKLLMAGTGMETARDTIDLTNKTADLGADCALVLTPCYYDSAMKTPALLEFFTQVADKSKIPVLIYNVPKFTHVNVQADFIAEISRHPNIVGMKDSHGDAAQLANFIRITRGQDFKVFVGTASILYPALTLGAVGGILALANCNPSECVEVFEAMRKNDHETARETYLRMLPVNTAVTATYGISGLKAACSMLGLKGGFVRKPLQEQSEQGKNGVRDILKTAGVL
jgi:Dihydrodipicolinate synthase/N-acetylneuraminate lyase